MLRYFAIATVLVIGAIVAVTAYHHYALHITVRGGRATMRPRAGASVPSSRQSPQGLRGDAPWALSALPGCMIQTQEWKGTLSWVRRHLPRSARLVAPSSVLRYNNCTIFVSRDVAVVRRGNDVLRIPPVAHLYRFSAEKTRPPGLALLRSVCTHAWCNAVLRVYRRTR